MRPANLGKFCLTGTLLFSLAGSLLAQTGEKRLFENPTLENFDFFLADNGQKEETFQFTSDGILKVSGTPFGWLETKESYRNFTLKVEVRYPDAEVEANSGLFLRIGEKNGSFLPPCLEIQLKTGSVGDIFGFHGYTLFGTSERSRMKEKTAAGGKLHAVAKFQDGQKAGTDVWNQLEVTCFEDFVLVRVNGKIVNWAYKAPVLEGKIGFQSEGGEVWFRNAIVIEE
ncbi:MAG: DUF1080 domain-containing protein [Planctomycetia bacterium]|nr:DUF1080 domain-containing protein [Planctomycetia bacterium]